jgi:hypothetical protein
MGLWSDEPMLLSSVRRSVGPSTQNMLSRLSLIALILSILLITPPSLAYSTLIKAKDRTMKHFDRNDDGYLNWYESKLYQTHRHFGYPLVTKKNQKPYDFNQDLMLQPMEIKQYLADKKNGILRKLKK